MTTTTSRITIKDVAKRWKNQYFHPYSDKWMKVRYRKSSAESAEVIYNEILKSQTLDQVDEAIANDSWTKNSCSECGARSREKMAVFDVNGGEYSHNVCKDCLTTALSLLK